jgi:proteasome lid subunit RPN8/RPN11
VTGPYPRIDSWIIPSAALWATIAAVDPSRLDGIEAGAFWMGRRSGTATVDAVVVPRGPGVEEHTDHWRVSADVYGVISRWAIPRRFSLLGVVHTHPGQLRPRLSDADRNRSVRAPGVLAVVIGSDGVGEDPDGWGWYAYEDGDYRELGRQERARRIEVNAGIDFEQWSANLLGCTEILHER